MGLTCTNEPVPGTGQAASMLLDSAAAEQGDCVQLPAGNGPCPIPASSCAGELFGGGLISPRPKLCQWFL